MTFKHIILKNSLSNQLASNDSGIALDIIKWKLRTRITRNACRSLLPCDFDTPFNPFQKIMWAPKLFQQLNSIKHNSLDLFHQQSLPDTSSSIPGSRFVFNGIFTLLASVLLLGGTWWQAALHSVAESPWCGARNVGHCLEPKSSHGHVETSGWCWLVCRADKVWHVSTHSFLLISYNDFICKSYVWSGLYLQSFSMVNRDILCAIKKTCTVMQGI